MYAKKQMTFEFDVPAKHENAAITKKLTPPPATVAVEPPVATVTETITPEVAARYLKLNHGNRRIVRSNVVRLVRALRNGEWKLNGEAIVFDWNGHLRQGQHRMMACVESGVTFLSQVARGVNPDVFPTFDSGRRRGASEVFDMAGKKNVKTLASAVRAYEILTHGWASAASMSTQCSLKLTNAHPSLQYWANKFHANPAVAGRFTASLVAVLAVAEERHNRAVLEPFMTALGSGANLQPGSPALVMRERFDRERRTAGMRLSSEHALALYIKAINAHLTGRHLGVLRYTEQEEFPTVV